MKPAYSLVIVLIMLVAAGFLVMLGDPSQKADLENVMELVGDAQRTATRPVMVVTRVTAAEEQELGRNLAARMFFGTESGSEEIKIMNDYVQRLGRSLLGGINRKEIEYHFHVIDHEAVNAFALPGGQIFVFSGLMDFVKSEAELATILGHEITHVDAGHCIELFQMQMAAEKIAGPLAQSRLIEKGMQFAMMTITGGYQKTQEFAADAGGLRLAITAGYDPFASEAVMKRLGEKFDGSGSSRNHKKPRDPLAELGKSVLVAAESYYNSHPPANERVVRLAALRASLHEPGKVYYHGCENLKQRKTRDLLPIDGEALLTPAD